MFSGTYLPRCPARPARATPWANSPATMPLALLLALVVLMLASAGRRAAADESPIRFVGPTSRLQPRLTNETGTPAVCSPSDAVPQQPPPLTAAANPTSGVQPLLAQRETPQRDLQVEIEVIPTPAQVPLKDSIGPGGMIEVPCFIAPPLSEIQANITMPTGDLPSDRARFCSVDTPYVMDSRLEFGWAQFDFHWSATGLCHKPLYFEEINAERYGYTVSRVLQPIISGGKFFLTIPALPYLMTVNRPCDCIYTLGQYRPGDCVPRRWNRVPLQAGAAIVEVGTIAGLILLIP